MLKIVLGTGNEHKIHEMNLISKPFEVEFCMPNLASGEFNPEETGETFEENAIKKASEISKYLNGRKCISDDSGIEIEYLDGFPGVFTKRWHAGSDRDRNLEIINKLKDVPKEKRKVKWISAIAFAEGEKIITAVSYIEGYISENVRGDNGFGFDEIFELENGKTLAELSSEEKNEISARKMALEMLKNKLVK